MRKLHGHLRAVREAALGATLPQARPAAMRPHADDLDAELDEAAQVQHELDDHLGCDVLGVRFQGLACARKPMTWTGRGCPNTA